MTAPDPAEVEALTEALYADAELGPGYMFRDDCEHLARRILASDWLAERDRRNRREAFVEAVQAFRDLHPMHGSTAGCGGGIGGQAVTSECAIDCPSPKHDRAQHAWRNIERQAFGDPTEPYDPEVTP